MVSDSKSMNRDPKDNWESTLESKYVKMFKSKFDLNQFPNDFDNWTVREQCAWINENLAIFFPNVPNSLLDFIPAFYYEGDCGRPLEEVPEWLDMDKYRRGQKFVQENYAAIIFATILGVMHVYSFNEALKPLILSKRSHTPYLAYKRYLSTIQRFFNWYEGKPWIKGTSAYKDMQSARKMHLMMRKKLCGLDNEQIDKESKIAKPWCPDRELFMHDFAEACPFEKYLQRPYLLIDNSPYKPKSVNLADMMLAQCGFLSLVILYPEKIGIHNATDEDVEAYCHMWRCYGYCLGIEENYNFCRDSLEEIRQRTRDIYQYWILPNFKDVTPEWMHMTRCLIESLSYFSWIGYMPYKTTLLFFSSTLNVSMPRLYASMNYVEWIVDKIWTFIFYFLKFSSFRAVFNKLLRKILKEAAEFSPKKHAELEEMSRKQLSSFSIAQQ
ncbi:uncharacterized protein LOC105432942 [Pogonomyrmex barbatus]|uniref:Uncharacterized protein LOC105432942 n=1 Tax=Pogonomyrmex barbatus TaxID=144034 RepID=A0A6I9WR14_9HYME|nr:uncharacterized protein LOC105432942 [Pogonomyrmex barbatus]